MRVPAGDIVWTGIPSELDGLEFPSVEFDALDQHLWLLIETGAGPTYRIAFPNVRCFSAIEESIYAFVADKPFQFPNRLNFTEDSPLARQAHVNFGGETKHYFLHSGDWQWQAVSDEPVVRRFETRRDADHALRVWPS